MHSIVIAIIDQVPFEWGIRPDFIDYNDVFELLVMNFPCKFRTDQCIFKEKITR